MRPDAPRNKIVLALKRAIEATFDEGKWLELGFLIDKERMISGHPRLLRSLHWGDPDYASCVMNMVPLLLGSGDLGGSDRANIRTFAEFRGLEAWLKKNDPDLHDELYGGGDLVPLTEVEEAGGALDIMDLSRHAARIRNGIVSDPAQAIGSAKELLETVLKSVLEDPSSLNEMPGLLKRACQKLGLDVASVKPDDPGAVVIRRILGNLGQVVMGVAQVRNVYGTGHGRLNTKELEIAHARFVVNSAVAAATFFLEVWQAQRSPF
jgi:hypothetical protein